MQYTYSPEKINDGALNQMRFELGDVFTANPAHNSLLCDEEIQAALTGRSFKRAKLFLIESLLARFSAEVDLKIHEAEFKLSERVPFWRKLRDSLKEELEQTDVAPSFGFSGKSFPEPFFTRNMHVYT